MRRGRLAGPPLSEDPGAEIVDTPSADPQPLDEGYYVENFHLVLETVVERYHDLLHPEELAFHGHFCALPEDSRRLFVRLTSRKGPLFRRDRLAYGEIVDLDEAIARLEAVDFLDRAEDLSGGDLLHLLLRDELNEVAKDLFDEPLPASARRDTLLNALLENVEDARLRRATLERIAVVRPLHQNHVLTFRLLFFGNLYQDFTEFVLRDLGMVRYEAYSMDRKLRRFPERKALDDDLFLRQLRQQIALLLHEGATEEALATALVVRDQLAQWHPQSRRHADRILARVARQLEREGEFEAALDLYADAEHPPARERRARVLARLGRLEEACALCEEIVAAPRDETETIFAPRFAHDLRRKQGEKLAPWKRRRRPTVERTLAANPGMTVESLVLAALEEDGRRGFFSENWLWKSLFGLAFWDLVFAPVAGVFQHPFQFGPLDLHTPEFRRTRATAVEDRLAELREMNDLAPRLLATFDAKQGIANALVSWHDTARQRVQLALERVRGPHLALVADRLSRDLRRYRRGFPDLFLFSEGDPGFELWEVKGPGDQLRAEQKRWIDYLNDHGIPARVVKVQFAAS